MERLLRRTMHRTLVAIVPLIFNLNVSQAQAPDPATTIAGVESLIAKAEQHAPLVSGALPPDVLDTLSNWRPERSGRKSPARIQRIRPADRHVQNLIADAICRQNAASLRVVHRLDEMLEGRLFDHHEAIVANRIARGHQLELSFQPIQSLLGNQELKDINRTRQLKRVLRAYGPEQAITLIWSFHHLCGDQRVR